MTYQIFISAQFLGADRTKITANVTFIISKMNFELFFSILKTDLPPPQNSHFFAGEGHRTTENSLPRRRSKEGKGKKRSER